MVVRTIHRKEKFSDITGSSIPGDRILRLTRIAELVISVSQTTESV